MRKTLNQAKEGSNEMLPVWYLVVYYEAEQIKKAIEIYMRWICREQYEKDFYPVLIVVVGQDFGKHMILHGAYNVTDVVQAR